MDNVISLNGFVAQKEQEKRDEEKAEYDALYDFVSEIVENNPPDMSPFFAMSEVDAEATTTEIAIMKLMDAITLLDNLGKKKEAHIINHVVADLLGIEIEK